MGDTYNCEIKMPVDFAAYLLSSSPPIGLSNIAEHFCDDENQKTYCSILNSQNTIKRGITGPLKSIINRPENQMPSDIESEDSDIGNLIDRDICEDSDSCLCSDLLVKENKTKDIKKKKVVFADSLGFALAKVKILNEASDVPPTLRHNLISELSQGSTEDVVEVPALKLNFTQPASDYVNFRKKVDSLCVSLENVILNDFTVEGTIRVKNLSFEKHVFVRVSHDEWKTFTDIEACFCQSNETSACVYDTFKFHINVPTQLDTKSKVEFCVCFNSIGTGSQYWDNNHGQNYQIVLAGNDVTSPPAHYTRDYKPNFEGVTSWTTYTSWANTDESPYY